jgi:hypothetical protein
VLEAPRLVTSPETGGYGLLGRSVLVPHEGRLVRSLLVRVAEAARVLRWRAAMPPGYSWAPILPTGI